MGKKPLRVSKNRSTKRSLDVCLFPGDKKGHYVDNRHRSRFSSQETNPTKTSISSGKKRRRRSVRVALVNPRLRVESDERQRSQSPTLKQSQDHEPLFSWVKSRVNPLRRHRRLGICMYEIVATVTTATPTGFKLMGHWPLRWWQARYTRFTMIQRRLLPNETLPEPQEPVIEEEISVDKDRWQDLEVGDRVIVRAFWPGESEIVLSEKGS
jgi:hypothetical protein